MRATKAGMIGMARTWALELAADGITVNVVAPGPIGDTDMFRGVVPTGSEREKRSPPPSRCKRLGRSDDVARAVMFFCRSGRTASSPARRSMSAAARASARS